MAVALRPGVDWTFVPTGVPSTFPTQHAGLRVWHGGTVVELCLVAVADAPTQPLRISKGGATYVIYLVDPADPNASPVRVATPAGIRAIRLKT